MDKAALRKHFIPLRRGAPTGDPGWVAAQLAKLLMPMPDAMVLAAYLPIRGEWDPWPVIQRLDIAQTALPLTPRTPGALGFKLWRPGEPTVEAMFKTQEPAPSAPDVALDRLYFLVPGVAMDLEGYRLGYGGGYYDRTFAALGAGLDRRRIIGMMLDCQVSQGALPREATDIPLGHLITPTRVESFV